MKAAPIFIEDCGLVTCLGRDRETNARALFGGLEHGLTRKSGLVPGRDAWVGAVEADLPGEPLLPSLDCRNNRLMQAALDQIAPSVEAARRLHGPDRIATILGTSTSGIASGEAALAERKRTGIWPPDFDYRQQEMGSISSFAQNYLGLTGPAYTISTACSSSAKVFASARRLMHAGVIDAAVIGGADTLCRMTLNGFNSLGLLAEEPCNPFSLNRRGITIGEGAAAFLVSRKQSLIRLLGIGETSDGYHLTAPSSNGDGARLSMLDALEDANLEPAAIAYINLHGTATPLNDAAEARAVSSVFPATVPCGSTKGATGHMLGATGGVEAAFLFLCLDPAYNPNHQLPPHIWDGVADQNLPALNLAPTSARWSGAPSAMMSNSFGFGGSNVSLILGTG